MVGEVWCDFVVLLVAGFLFGIDCGFSFSRRDIVSGSLSLRYGGVGWAWALSFVDVFLGGWRFKSVSVCWVCCGFWSVRLTEGESCITVFPRVDAWKLEISRADCLVLCRLTGRDS